MKPFRVEFTDNKLTGNAGLVHLGRFAKKLRLQNILERHISISRGENAKYDVAHYQEGIAPRTQHHPRPAHQGAGPIDHPWLPLDIEAAPGLLFQRAVGTPGKFPDGPLLGLSKTPKAKKQSKR